MRSSLLLLAGATACAVIAGSVAPSDQGPFATLSRWHAFRFEAAAAAEGIEQFADDFLAAAERNGAFGWMQTIRDKSGTKIVGEVRAAKPEGLALESFIEHGQTYFSPGAYKSSVMVYKDTLIRYHFADFRVIDTARKMCFPAPPHQCDDGESVDSQLRTTGAMPGRLDVEHEL